MQSIIDTIKNKKGIEIGGPTELFYPGRRLSLYDQLTSLDNINILNNDGFPTIPVNESVFYAPGLRTPGKQFNINDKVPNHYEYLISSHAIEHFANPIKIIKEWRNLTNMGYVFAVIPHKDYCWDTVRPVTTIEHLIKDYKMDIGEDDMTHLEEVLNTDHPYKYRKNMNFEELCKNNEKTRVMHHHCFDLNLVKEMFEYCNLETIECFQHSDKLQLIYFGKFK